MPAYSFQDRRGKERCFLFIAVPKTGNTALHTAFVEDGWTAFYDRSQNALLGRLKCPAQHFHATILETLFNVETFDDIFMVVRHPVQRLMSDYLWLTRNAQRGQRPPFDPWVHRALEQYPRTPFMYDNHLRPQSAFWLPQARVFHYEDGLERVIDEVYARLGVRRTRHKALQRANTSADNTGMRTSDIDAAPETIKRIETFYAADFKNFGYARETEIRSASWCESDGWFPSVRESAPPVY
mgnify:CR=1 FL=1